MNTLWARTAGPSCIRYNATKQTESLSENLEVGTGIRDEVLLFEAKVAHFCRLFLDYISRARLRLSWEDLRA